MQQKGESFFFFLNIHSDWYGLHLSSRYEPACVGAIPGHGSRGEWEVVSTAWVFTKLQDCKLLYFPMCAVLYHSKCSHFCGILNAAGMSKRMDKWKRSTFKLLENLGVGRSRCDKKQHLYFAVGWFLEFPPLSLTFDSLLCSQTIMLTEETPASLGMLGSLGIECFYLVSEYLWK